jgi:hypothetical protein
LPQYRDLRGDDEFPNVHLDRGDDSRKSRDLLDRLGFDAHIAAKGQPAPIQAGQRWPVERLHSWMNGYGKLRRCTDKRQGHRRVLPLPRSCSGGHPTPDQPGPKPLPLARPTNHSPPALTIICRAL